MAKRPSTILAVALAATAAGALALSGVASADTGTHSTARAPHATTAAAKAPAPLTAGSTYLALGDSVPFGFREPTNTPTPTYSDASTFVGYPEDVAAALKVTTVNLACPGETSGSLVNNHVRSNGCEGPAPKSTTPGYRQAFPLHVAYPASQLAAAGSYLRAHKNVRLVSLQVGANDGFICQETTTDGCQSLSELGPVLAKVEANVTRILTRIRNSAHYSGQIVIVQYYSLDYRSTLANQQASVLNAAVASAAAPFHVRIAKSFALFRQAAAQAGGDTCAAGLLTTLSGGGCGVHPSVAGQALLAQAVEKAAVTG